MTTVDERPPPLNNDAIEAARRMLGTPLRRPRPRKRVASKDAIIEYTRAIGSRNPLYLQDTYASGTYYGSLIAHPTWLYCVDNTDIYAKLPGLHAIYGSVAWEWHHPIRIGDSFTSTAKLTDMRETKGAFCGKMVVQSGEVEYRNQHGQLVATAATEVLRTPRDSAQAMGKYATLERSNYSAGDIQRIYQAYDDEYIRGEPPRYWEDQSDDEELPPIVRGPLTTEDINLFVACARGTPAYRAFLEHWRRHPADAYIDQLTGMPDSWDASFLKDEPARNFGFPAAHDTGIQRVAWLEDLVTNWMGDHAFLRRLEVRLTRPCIHGDSTWCKGAVVKKYREGPEYLIDLRLRCEDQRGEETAVGSATVSLVSKDPDSLPPILLGAGDGF